MYYETQKSYFKSTKKGFKWKGNKNLQGKMVYDNNVKMLLLLLKKLFFLLFIDLNHIKNYTLLKANDRNVVME